MEGKIAWKIQFFWSSTVIMSWEEGAALTFTFEIFSGDQYQTCAFKKSVPTFQAWSRADSVIRILTSFKFKIGDWGVLIPVNIGILGKIKAVHWRLWASPHKRQCTALGTSIPYVNTYAYQRDWDLGHRFLWCWTQKLALLDLHMPA